MTRDRTETGGPHLILVGVNYSTTPLALRERLSVPRSRMPNAIEVLRGYIGEGVILATCNRTEIYAIGSREHGEESAVLEFLRSWSGITGEGLEPYLYSYHSHTAMKHLLSTASGLRSMIVGEYEILGQVRQALEDAERTSRRRRDECAQEGLDAYRANALEVMRSRLGELKDLKANELLVAGFNEAIEYLEFGVAKDWQELKTGEKQQ